MKINIPQYLRASVDWTKTQSYEPLIIDVYIGETPVFTAEVESYDDEEDAEMEAISAFGEKLKSLIEGMD